MPGRDPNLWQALLAYVATAWPQLYAAGLAFLVGMLRSLHAGNRVSKSWLEAMLCGCLTLAAFPVLHYFGLPVDLAAALGAVVAFKGTEWFGNRADELYEKIIGRWLK
ncbi:phage holin, lambda family [Halomonas sp. KG2]|uniref:phage holin, lambda family n=1 Tax=Halomonas sp. KG2 TaxID=2951138 RepID=UPI0026494B82|nr:phage holin, lambda family [Halomonas sp. KG2]WKD26602.1 phage holin, lambda family [Halomonas sp. KG2]